VRRCEEMSQLLAGHVFEALEEDERVIVQDHLEHCADCRLVHSRLQELPGLLDLAGGVEATIPRPPPLLEASVVARMGYRSPSGSGLGEPAVSRGSVRRGFSRRLQFALAAAGTVLAVAVAATLAIVTSSRSPASAAQVLRLAAAARQPQARAVAVLRRRAWGTQVELRIGHLTPTRGREVYELWFVSSAGRLSGGTFTVGRSGRAIVTLASAAHPGQYQMIGITVQPDGLHPGRVGPNVLRARIPT
jgi:hypothetical protein